MDKTAFEPRIGVAWKPFGSQKTAIRAGYAIFHDSSWNQGAQGLWENPPYFAESDNFRGPCGFNNSAWRSPITAAIDTCSSRRPSQLVPITTPPSPQSFPGTLQSQNLDFKQGRVQQFNVNIEHQLPGNVVLTAGYAGSRSSHILVDGLNLNVGSPTACGTVVGIHLRLRLRWNGIRAEMGCPNIPVPIDDRQRQRCRQGPIRLFPDQSRNQECPARPLRLVGLHLLAHLRLRHAGWFGYIPWAPPTFRCRAQAETDWALSVLNLNHQFTASVTYDLPFGKGKQFGSNWNGALNAILGNWEVDVIQRVTSGFPLFVVDSANGSGVAFSWNGNSLNRPDQVGDPNRGGTVAANPGCVAPAQVHTLQNWFNPCAFAPAADGELGNANRAPLYGPRFVNTDLSFIKHFPLPYESMRLGLPR